MQEKSQTFLEFSERTELLAAKSDVKLSDLPRELGISTGMFHACRSGKSPISPKTWRKLEAAERAAGFGSNRQVVGLKPAFPVESSTDPKESGLMPDQFPDVGEMIALLRGQLAEKDRQIGEKDRQLERLLGIIERQASALAGERLE